MMKETSQNVVNVNAIIYCDSLQWLIMVLLTTATVTLEGCLKQGFNSQLEIEVLPQQREH